MSATSIFSGLASEVTQSRGLARNMDKRVQAGKVLFHCDFNDGFQGWRDHYDGTTPQPPISLSGYPNFDGKLGLMLSTGDLPNIDNQMPWRSTSTYKNLSRYFDTGLVSFSGFFTTGSGRGALAWGSWGVGIDTQKWDSSSRGFYKILCRDDAELGPAWFITSNTGSQILIPGTRGSAGTNVTHGENENKFNYTYLRLTVDLSANNGLGGYLEAQINHQVFDLTGLGGGRGMQEPQGGNIDLTSQGRYANYSGGFNCGVMLSASSINPYSYPAMLFADELLCTMQDA